MRSRFPTKRRSRSATVLTVAMLPVALWAEDVVHFKSPEMDPFRGTITSFLDEGVVLRIVTELPGGRRGSSVERIPWRVIDYLEFSPFPGEEALLADPGAASEEQLKNLWLEELKHLERPRSNAGKIGLLYAERLLGGDSDFSRQRAMELFELIEAKDWNAANHPVAKQGRLRALIKLGRIQDAMREAVRMAEESDDPLVLIESQYVLATAEFDQLRAIEEEHPRWDLDDEVRPIRNAHFNDAIDQFLFAYLFYGSEEEASARGLLGAAAVHRFANDPTNARLCAEDVVKLYPQTSYRPQAEKLLQELSNQASSEE